MTEQTAWRESATITGGLRLGISEVLKSLRHYLLVTKPRTSHHRSPGGERRRKRERSTIFLERTRKGHRQSDPPPPPPELNLWNRAPTPPPPLPLPQHCPAHTHLQCQTWPEGERRCRRNFGAAARTWRKLRSSAGQADYRSVCMTDTVNAEEEEDLHPMWWKKRQVTLHCTCMHGSVHEREETMTHTALETQHVTFQGWGLERALQCVANQP